MPAVVPIMMVASVGLTAYSAIQQNKAARNAARVEEATADYNARADIAASEQLDLDTQQNVRTAREEDAIYLSRQAASYAAAGVLATTGSPLHAQITNAGKMEQRIQQAWMNSNQQQQRYASAAKIGRLEGAARASASRAQGTLALLNGGARIAGSIYGAYDSGAFSGTDPARPTIIKPAPTPVRKIRDVPEFNSTFGAYA